MTVQIIERPEPEECICDKCKCTLSYELSDVKTTTTNTDRNGLETLGHIICPNCKYEILVLHSE